MTPLDRPAIKSEAGNSDACYLTISGLRKRFGDASVLDDLSLVAAKGEFVSLLGPSGCGKTTVLRLVAGLLRPDNGSIAVGQRDVTNLPAHRRNISIVFQNYALFPHLSVADNVAFGLRAKRMPKPDVERAVKEALALVRMDTFAERRITSLSGGQQQRIAVARAIAVRPALLLLDEPFSALDRKLRETMQIELRNLLRMLNITSVFVTHDQEEALVMSDRVAVMRQGQIEQIDDPRTLYEHPASLYVLDFIGRSSQLSGDVVDGQAGTVVVSTKWGLVRAAGNFIKGAKVVVALRPEAFQLNSPEPQANQLTFDVADRIFIGGKTVLHFAVGAETADRALAEGSQSWLADIAPGAKVTVHFRVSDTKVFPAI
jgi:putative spermidine/putrescine transport system ATP-binding protein